MPVEDCLDWLINVGSPILTVDGSPPGCGVLGKHSVVLGFWEPSLVVGSLIEWHGERGTGTAYIPPLLPSSDYGCYISSFFRLLSHDEL